MAVNTSSLMSCTYGAAGFMLTGAKYSEVPTISDGAGRVATHALFEGEGFFDADTLDDFNAKNAAIPAAMRLDGQPFAVTQFGQAAPYLTLNPGQCLDGAPFCEFQIVDGDGPLHRKITFKLRARLASPVISTFKYGVSATPDGLVTIRQSGTVAGSGAAALFQLILDGLVGGYSSPNWITTYDYERNPYSDLFTYRITARQCATPMPSGGATAVDGESTSRIEIDEQHRMTSIYEYDYLIVGNPMSWHQSLRAAIPGGSQGIYRESYSATATRGIRVRSSFSVITGADANAMISWTQTVTVRQDQTVYEQHAYPGAQPIAVQLPTTLGSIIQRGSATAVGQWIEAPSPIPTVLTAIPEIAYDQVNVQENRTTWQYEGLATDEDGDPVQFDPPSENVRPASPEFY